MSTATIIGSGPNGLSAAIVLAASGVRTTVLERNGQIGGGCSTAEVMHDEEAARKSYEDFLAVWKNADPDLPIYKRAKAEYAALRKTAQ
jgi:ribulose 1,5-bisphosphate synthetase/thiazole synthase